MLRPSGRLSHFVVGSPAAKSFSVTGDLQGFPQLLPADAGTVPSFRPIQFVSGSLPIHSLLQELDDKMKYTKGVVKQPIINKSSVLSSFMAITFKTIICIVIITIITDHNYH